MNDNLRLHALDGWRGLCALLVCMYHFHALGYYHYVPLIRNGWLAVDFFFVLSGFVITHAYGGRVKTWQDFKNFIGRRFGRVWPLHVVMLAVFIAFYSAMYYLSHRYFDGSVRFEDSKSLESILPNLLLIHSLGIYEHGTWNGPSWSISVEFYVYVTFALVMLLARSRLTLCAVTLVLASVVVLYLFSPKYMETATEYGFFRCLAGFGTGHLVYRLRLHFSPRLNHSSLAEFAALALAIFAFLYMAEGPATLLTPVVFGVVLFVYATGSGCISRFLSSRPIAFVGERSYSIYMVHQFIILIISYIVYFLEKKVVYRSLRIDDPDQPGTDLLTFNDQLWLMDIAMIFFLLLVITASAFTYRFVEVPARDWFNKKFRHAHAK